jgi:hypothetical protein
MEVGTMSKDVIDGGGQVALVTGTEAERGARDRAQAVAT